MRTSRRSRREYPREIGDGLNAVKKLIPWIVGVLLVLVLLWVNRFVAWRWYPHIAPTRAKIHALCLGVDLYEVDMRRYPPSLYSLWASGGETNWRGPYVKSPDLFLDQWTNRFRYRITGDRYELRSSGADGVLETRDDITAEGSGLGIRQLNETRLSE